MAVILWAGLELNVFALSVVRRDGKVFDIRRDVVGFNSTPPSTEKDANHRNNHDHNIDLKKEYVKAYSKQELILNTVKAAKSNHY